MKSEIMTTKICHRTMSHKPKYCIGTKCMACKSYNNKYKSDEYFCIDLKEPI